MNAVQVLLRRKDHLPHDSRVLRTGTILQSIEGFRSFILVFGDDYEEYLLKGNHIIVIRLPFWYPKKWCEFSTAAVESRIIPEKIIRKVVKGLLWLPLKWHFKNEFLKKMEALVPDIIWANDFETLFLAVGYKKIKPDACMIYDSH